MRLREADVSLDEVRTSRWATLLTFFCSDAVAFAAVIGFTYILSNDSVAVIGVASVTGLLAAAFTLFGLYSTTPLHPAQELQRICLITTVTFAAFSASWVLAGGTGLWFLFASWLLTVTSLSTCRILLRVLCSKASWWGTPVIVLGSGAAGEAVVTTLKRWPELGLKPVALLSNSSKRRGDLDGVPVLGRTSLAPRLAQAYNIPYAIAAMPELSQRELIIEIGSYTKFFKHVFIASGYPGTQSLWAASQPHAGLVGYSTQHASQNTWSCFGKRLVDFAGAAVGLIVFAPVFFALAVLIKLDSPGPVFFRQKRMGREGRCFNVLKFRSMYVNAEERLQEILHKDSVRREEYETFHKLRDDPRITPIGRGLRRASLDELPQLLNVLKGDLSLVGPRAYMPRELPKMVGLERAVLQGRPGLTGLWQVSGRNDLQFQERVYLDVHYTQNCSFWLDVYILIKTLPVVLTGDGAS